MAVVTLQFRIGSLDAIHDPPLTAEETLEIVRRFWSRVRKDEGDDACWPWLGKPMKRGYGRASIGRHKTMLAHRLSFILNVGPLRAAECALHHCDNPPCIRPAHLFKGDRGDNARDMAAKGRQSVQRHPERRPQCSIEGHARGEAIGRARVTASQVVEIRQRFSGGERKASLVRAFGLGFCGITSIVKGLTWKHVGGPLTEERP